jgi:hypothetical protein
VVGSGAARFSRIESISGGASAVSQGIGSSPTAASGVRSIIRSSQSFASCSRWACDGRI